MTPAESAQKILDTMLGHLGLIATVDIEDSSEELSLQIRSADSGLIIGQNGARLDDLQYLVNRILRRQHPDAPRIKVDCEHFRTQREDHMADEVREIAERVKSSGKPYQMRPLNAYYRRLVHNFLADDPEIETHSSDGDDRLKRITISLKNPTAP